MFTADDQHSGLTEEVEDFHEHSGEMELEVEDFQEETIVPN